MKKIFALFICLALVLTCFAGCYSSSYRTGKNIKTLPKDIRQALQSRIFITGSVAPLHIRILTATDTVQKKKQILKQRFFPPKVWSGSTVAKQRKPPVVSI